MNSAAATTTWDRIAAVVSFDNPSRHLETYGFSGTSGKVFLEGQFLIPRNRPSKTLYVFMHPATTLQLLPMPTALAGAGAHVLCAASRYPKNDSSLIMENVAIDLGAWIRHAREERGYEKVVLVGWSGGGSLSLFYQAQAECPSITQTPAGDPVDLAGADLPAADGIIFIAAHSSRAEVLTEWLDPSILDEQDPDKRDLEFDIYHPDCPNKPPFSSDFVAAFRRRQYARNQAITAWCQEKLDELRKKNTAERERAFVVHRTMCDVRWIDTTIDPNGRKENWCYLGDPVAANVAPAGLARYSSLRSWLSQWSYDLSNAKGTTNAAQIRRTPVLQIVNEADDAVPATHNPMIHESLATADKKLISIPGATHYYLGQPELLKQCLTGVFVWAEKKGF